MNPKHGDWHSLGSTHNPDFHGLNFHTVEIFNSFNVEMTEKGMNFNFSEN